MKELCLLEIVVDIGTAKIFSFIQKDRHELGMALVDSWAGLAFCRAQVIMFQHMRFSFICNTEIQYLMWKFYCDNKRPECSSSLWMRGFFFWWRRQSKWFICISQRYVCQNGIRAIFFGRRIEFLIIYLWHSPSWSGLWSNLNFFQINSSLSVSLNAQENNRLTVWIGWTCVFRPHTNSIYCHTWFQLLW